MGCFDIAHSVMLVHKQSNRRAGISSTPTWIENEITTRRGLETSERFHTPHLLLLYAHLSQKTNERIQISYPILQYYSNNTTII